VDDVQEAGDFEQILEVEGIGLVIIKPGADEALDERPEMRLLTHSEPELARDGEGLRLIPLLKALRSLESSNVRRTLSDFFSSPICSNELVPGWMI